MEHYGIHFHAFVRKVVRTVSRGSPGSRLSLTFAAMVGPATSGSGVAG